MALGADLASTRPPCVSATSKRKHVKRGTGSELCRIALWDFFWERCHFFHWLLQNCAGNWVRIRPSKQSHNAI